MLRKVLLLIKKTFCKNKKDLSTPSGNNDVEIVVNYTDSYFFLWNKRRMLFLVLLIKNNNAELMSYSIKVLPQGTLKKSVPLSQSKGPNLLINPKIIKSTVRENSIIISGQSEKEESLIICDFYHDKNFRLELHSLLGELLIPVDLDHIKIKKQ